MNQPAPSIRVVRQTGATALTPEERAVLQDWTPPVWLMVPGDYTGGRTYDELCNGVHDPVWAEGDDE